MPFCAHNAGRGRKMSAEVIHPASRERASWYLLTALDRRALLGNLRFVPGHPRAKLPSSFLSSATLTHFTLSAIAAVVTKFFRVAGNGSLVFSHHLKMRCHHETPPLSRNHDPELPRGAARQECSGEEVASKLPSLRMDQSGPAQEPMRIHQGWDRPFPIRPISHGRRLCVVPDCLGSNNSSIELTASANIRPNPYCEDICASRAEAVAPRTCNCFGRIPSRNSPISSVGM